MATLTIRCTAHPGTAQGVGCITCADITEMLVDGQAAQAEAIANGEVDAATIEIFARE